MIPSGPITQQQPSSQGNLPPATARNRTPSRGPRQISCRTAQHAASNSPPVRLGYDGARSMRGAHLPVTLEVEKNPRHGSNHEASNLSKISEGPSGSKHGGAAHRPARDAVTESVSGFCKFSVCSKELADWNTRSKRKNLLAREAWKAAGWAGHSMTSTEKTRSRITGSARSPSRARADP